MDKELKTPESQRRAAKKYYEKMRANPEFRAKQTANTTNWLMRKADLYALKEFHERRLKEIQQYINASNPITS